MVTVGVETGGGGYSKKMLLDYCIKSKVCNTCVFAARRFASAEPHVCPKNHLLGCSKSMKSDAGVEMVIKAWDKYPMFYTTTMAFNDDSTIGATANVLLRIYYYKIPKKWRKKGKPWMPSITHQRAGSLIQSLPPSSRPNSPLLLDVSRPKMRCEINKERLPATENLLWMLHKEKST